MTAQLLNYLPILALIVPIIGLIGLAKSAKAMADQSQKLSSKIISFSSSYESKKDVAQFVPKSLDSALVNRNEYLAKRSKSRKIKQRRLVDRLRALSSQESE